MTNQWKVDNSLGVLRIVDNDGDVIAEFWNPNHEEIARKMVAAEELIEALQAMFDLRDCYTRERWEKATSLGLSAIAKATGA